jgi:hypothetical protein
MKFKRKKNVVCNTTGIGFDIVRVTVASIFIKDASVSEDEAKRKKIFNDGDLGEYIKIGKIKVYASNLEVVEIEQPHFKVGDKVVHEDGKHDEVVGTYQGREIALIAYDDDSGHDSHRIWVKRLKHEQLEPTEKVVEEQPEPLTVENFLNRIYRIKGKDTYLKLWKKRDSNINTYIEVDEYRKEVIAKQKWSVRNLFAKNLHIMYGFSKLTEVP